MAAGRLLGVWRADPHAHAHSAGLTLGYLKRKQERVFEGSGAEGKWQGDLRVGMTKTHCTRM